MSSLSEKGFGYLIAFGLPGFLLLWGLSFTFPELAKWLAAASVEKAPTIAGFFYTTIASFALGLVLDAFSSIIIENLMCATIVTRCPIDDRKLKNADVLATFQAIVDNHYRYFQCYANSLIVFNAVFAVRLIVVGLPGPWWLWWVGLLAVDVVLVLKARDDLGSYYGRASDVTR